MTMFQDGFGVRAEIIDALVFRVFWTIAERSVFYDGIVFGMWDIRRWQVGRRGRHKEKARAKFKNSLFTTIQSAQVRTNFQNLKASNRLVAWRTEFFNADGKGWVISETTLWAKVQDKGSKATHLILNVVTLRAMRL